MNFTDWQNGLLLMAGDIIQWISAGAAIVLLILAMLLPVVRMIKSGR